MEREEFEQLDAQLSKLIDEALAAVSTAVDQRNEVADELDKDQARLRVEYRLGEVDGLRAAQSALLEHFRQSIRQ